MDIGALVITPEETGIVVSHLTERTIGALPSLLDEHKTCLMVSLIWKINKNVLFILLMSRANGSRKVPT